MLLKHGQPTSFSFFLMNSSFLAFVALAVSGFAEAATYSRTANLFGKSFLDAFEWVAIADPTHGRTFVVYSSFTKRFVSLYEAGIMSPSRQRDHKDCIQFLETL